MYHSLLLWRLLQCLDLAAVREKAELRALLGETASQMLGWLKAVCFSDGTWPAVNDSAAGIAPAPAALFEASAEMGIVPADVCLSDSGYRMIRRGRYELFMDVGGIQPAWQPGHAHADTGTFCLHVDGRPVIVDTGCSTYEDQRIRAEQRGTAAHNTVSVNGRDSSELWSRFRVGKRCRITSFVEESDSLTLKYLNADDKQICRIFKWNENVIQIIDHCSDTSAAAGARLHFDPRQEVTDTGAAHVIHIEYEGIEAVSVRSCSLAGGFNILLPSACLLLSGFSERAVVRIHVDSPTAG